ncbi:DEAD/DEAH box helicase, partial [Kibdelosporangium lantanae]
ETPADERRSFARTPPDILVTTPESLFLILTSAARESLTGVETVIVDEVHAVTGTKRGAHLAVSLERLDALLTKPVQRIGLSATVRPIEEVSAFLAGGRPVTVVAPKTAKTVEITVQVPVEDMANLDSPPSTDRAPGDLPVEGGIGTLEEITGEIGTPRRPSIWPAVEERILELVRQHRSTIVFANSRRLAERLTARLNELAEEHQEVGDPIDIDHLSSPPPNSPSAPPNSPSTPPILTPPPPPHTTLP